MSPPSVTTNSSSKLSQFGLYRTIDARTEEFLKLSRKKQIRQGCLCAAISTTVTVALVITTLIIYRYSTIGDVKPRLHYENLRTVESISNISLADNVDSNGATLIPMLLNALNFDRYQDRDVNSKESAEDAYRNKIRTNKDEWNRHSMPKSYKELKRASVTVRSKKLEEFYNNVRKTPSHFNNNNLNDKVENRSLQQQLSTASPKFRKKGSKSKKNNTTRTHISRQIPRQFFGLPLARRYINKTKHDNKDYKRIRTYIVTPRYTNTKLLKTSTESSNAITTVKLIDTVRVIKHINSTSKLTTIAKLNPKKWVEDFSKSITSDAINPNIEISRNTTKEDFSNGEDDKNMKGTNFSDTDDLASTVNYRKYSTTATITKSSAHKNCRCNKIIKQLVKKMMASFNELSSLIKSIHNSTSCAKSKTRCSKKSSKTGKLRTNLKKVKSIFDPVMKYYEKYGTVNSEDSQMHNKIRHNVGKNSEDVLKNLQNLRQRVNKLRVKHKKKLWNLLQYNNTLIDTTTETSTAMEQTSFTFSETVDNDEPIDDNIKKGNFYHRTKSERSSKMTETSDINNATEEGLHIIGVRIKNKVRSNHDSATERFNNDYISMKITVGDYDITTPIIPVSLIENEWKTKVIKKEPTFDETLTTEITDEVTESSTQTTAYLSKYTRKIKSKEKINEIERLNFQHYFSKSGFKTAEEMNDEIDRKEKLKQLKSTTRRIVDSSDVTQDFDDDDSEEINRQNDLDPLSSVDQVSFFSRNNMFDTQFEVAPYEVPFMVKYDPSNYDTQDNLSTRQDDLVNKD